MDYLDRLASRICELSLADLEATTITAAKRVVLDTLGAIVAGSALAVNTEAARWAAARAGSPTATLIGHGLRAEPSMATFVNATAAVSLELDEGNRHGGGHPAVHVVPAALAAAEEAGASGARLLEAVIAGYEAYSRIATATDLHDVVHPHGTWGAIGAAVATAKLMDFDEAEMRAVVSLAASMSPANSWTPCFEGATVRNLYPGRSGLQGMLAAHLLRCGFTALADGPSDVFGRVLGDRFDSELVLAGWGAPFRIERGYFKFHACCLYNHVPLQLLAAFRAESPFEAGDVERIEVTTFPAAAGLTDPAPTTMLGAKFSIPYAIAASLVLGATDVAAFEHDARENPRLRALAERVVLRTDASMSLRDPDKPLARLAVSLKDGRSFVRDGMTMRGDADDPVPDAEISAKFLSLTGPVLDGRAAAVPGLVDRLEHIADLGELTGALG